MDYNNMTKSELIVIIKERDNEIEYLKRCEIQLKRLKKAMKIN